MEMLMVVIFLVCVLLLSLCFYVVFMLVKDFKDGNTDSHFKFNDYEKTVITVKRDDKNRRW